MGWGGEKFGIGTSFLLDLPCELKDAGNHVCVWPRRGALIPWRKAQERMMVGWAFCRLRAAKLR
ncbi:hypothetical protein A2U01_0055742, partial [Trifolium medium]|nr:hypothetical protein [Trifolium medium]